MDILIKILKNNSGAPLELLGVSDIAHGEQIEVNPSKWIELIERVEIHDLVASGDIIVNDGVSDLNIDAALRHIKKLFVDYAPLTKDPTGFENLEYSSISFNDSNSTFSITPTNASGFDFYIRGVRYNKSSTDNLVLPDIEGNFHIFYNMSGILSYSEGIEHDDANTETASIADLYWDSTNKKAINLCEERHGVSMPWATHRRFSDIEGLQVSVGDFEAINTTPNGDGSLDIHAQMGFTEGSIYDGGLLHHVVTSSTPTLPFEQRLQTYAYIPLYYIEGSGTIKWRKLEATPFPMAWDAGNLVRYNYWNGSTWSLANADEGSVLCTYILATNNIHEPIIGLVGQAKSTNLIQALEENRHKDLELNNFPFDDYLFLSRIFFDTKNSYTNQPKASNLIPADLIYGIENPDRYAFQGQINGNAGIGKYLELFWGIDSNEAPFIFPENSYMRTITLHTSALSTGTIGFFNTLDLVNPIFELSMTNQDNQRYNVSYYFYAGDEICMRITAGSFQKPTLRIWIQTDL